VRQKSIFLLVVGSIFVSEAFADSFPGGMNNRASTEVSGLTQYRASIDSFNPVAADDGTTGTFRVVLEEPVSGEIHGGVGNLRGWAIASDGIEKVEIWTVDAYEKQVLGEDTDFDFGNLAEDVRRDIEKGSAT